MICCGGLDLRIVIKIDKYENKNIPLTFFYENLKTKAFLFNKIADHIENKFLVDRKLPDRLTFMVKGRFNPDNYRCYIHGNIKTVALGNFELIELYTFEKVMLKSILDSNIDVFSALD